MGINWYIVKDHKIYNHHMTILLLFAGIQAAYYNHTRLVQTLQQSVMHNYGSQLQPCCSPVSFRHPQSLIYRDHEAVVRKIDIPDLIVGECGCI